jgi:hypothetical protein
VGPLAPVEKWLRVAFREPKGSLSL